MCRSRRIILLGIGAFLGTLLSSCRFSEPPETFRQPSSGSSGSTAVITQEASGGTMDFTNERTPETPESLEVSRVNTGANLSVSLSGAALFVGSPQAQRTLTVYSDYSCLYCQQFSVEDLPWLEQTYVATGKLRVERLFVPMSPLGNLMARAALCSTHQNRFRELDARFAATPLLSDQQLDAALKSAKVKYTKDFTTCLSTEAPGLLAAELARFKEAGFERVPTFVLGKTSWLGLLTREDLKQTIEAALKP